MNKQEYLDQISAKPAAKKGLPAFLTSKYLWIALVGVLILAALLGLGSSLSGNKITNKERIPELILQLNGLGETLETYQNSVKSSTLRSYSSSLSNVLSVASQTLTNYATQVYKYKEKSIPKTTQNRVAEHIQELNDELFDAKINGNLDEIFDLKMVYEISLLLAQAQAILDNTTSPELRTNLTSSISSLTNLYNQFDGYQLGM